MLEDKEGDNPPSLDHSDHFDHSDISDHSDHSDDSDGGITQIFRAKALSIFRAKASEFST